MGRGEVSQAGRRAGRQGKGHKPSGKSPPLPDEGLAERQLILGFVTQEELPEAEAMEAHYANTSNRSHSRQAAEVGGCGGGKEGASEMAGRAQVDGGPIAELLVDAHYCPDTRG